MVERSQFGWGGSFLTKQASLQVAERVRVAGSGWGEVGVIRGALESVVIERMRLDEGPSRGKK
jgi:hypothetical protein